MAGVAILLMVWISACFGAAPQSSTVPSSINPSSKSAQVVAKIIEGRINSSNYSRRLRPDTDEDPLKVYININVNDISYISETQMEYSMTLFLRQLWTDDRLAYNDTGYSRNITLNYNQYELLWVPDLYIVNLKSGVFHEITVPNRRIILSPDGLVYYSQRLTVTLICDMELLRYPMDNQTCYVEFSSYAYTTDDLSFRWRFDADAVELDKFNLPEYTITSVTTEVCTAESKDGTLFPCLRVYFHLSRRLKTYILNTYLPSFLVVLLSWLSFWIEPESTPARTSLSILTILTITTQSSGLMRSLPSGSVTKAIDVWMATCLVFVFGAFIEYSVVNTLARRNKKKKAEAVSKRTTVSEDNDLNGPKDEQSWCARRGGFWFLFDYKRNPVMALERSSRVLFPFFFFVFCLMYWPYYLVE